MPYPWMSYAAAHAYEAEAAREGVSEVARSGRGFMRAYEKHRTKAAMWKATVPGTKGQTWGLRRRHFIERTLAQYRKNPTHRRRLALIMWAYDPENDTPGKEMSDRAAARKSHAKNAAEQRAERLRRAQAAARAAHAALEAANAEVVANDADAEGLEMMLAAQGGGPVVQGDPNEFSGEGLARRGDSRAPGKGADMAHMTDMPRIIEFLGRGRGRVTKPQARKVMDMSPHMHVLAHGSAAESKAILGAASPALTAALASAAKMALNRGALSGGDIARAAAYVAAKNHGERVAVLKGAGFWDVMKKIGRFTLKALPVIAKIAPIVLAAL